MQTVPYIIERTGNSERGYDLYSRMLVDRIVFLQGEVMEQNSNLIVSSLLYLDSQSNDDIMFYINSPGGLVTAGMAIYDTMQMISSEVNTVVMGQACSMGSFLSTAGAPGKRFILPNARMMIHQPSGGAQGQASDMEIQLKEILKIKETMTDLYVHHNSKGKTRKYFEKALDRDTFLGADESVEVGLVDEVLKSKK